MCVWKRRTACPASAGGRAYLPPNHLASHHHPAESPILQSHANDWASIQMHGILIPSEWQTISPIACGQLTRNQNLPSSHRSPPQTNRFFLPYTPSQNIAPASCSPNAEAEWSPFGISHEIYP